MDGEVACGASIGQRDIRDTPPPLPPPDASMPSTSFGHISPWEAYLDDSGGILGTQELHEAKASALLLSHHFLLVAPARSARQRHLYRRDVHLAIEDAGGIGHTACPVRPTLPQKSPTDSARKPSLSARDKDEGNENGIFGLKSGLPIKEKKEGDIIQKVTIRTFSRHFRARTRALSRIPASPRPPPHPALLLAKTPNFPDRDGKFFTDTGGTVVYVTKASPDRTGLVCAKGKNGNS